MILEVVEEVCLNLSETCLDVIFKLSDRRSTDMNILIYMDIQCFHSVTRIDALCSNLQKYLYLLLSLFAKLSFVQMTIICQYRADFDEN